MSTGRNALLPFLLILPSLQATLNEPLSLEWGSGYRNDHFHWYLKEGGGGALLEDENFRDLSLWENALTLHLISRDLVFQLRATFSCLGSGSVNGNQSVSGWAADGEGMFGYAVNLTPQRTYQVTLTPLVGFGYNHETFGGAHLDWWGPFIGGELGVKPGGQMELGAGYGYHFLRMRFHGEVCAQDGGNFGHSGYARIDHRFGGGWCLGLLGLIDYFFSHDLAAEGAVFKGRWTSISGLVTIGREL